MKKAVYWDMDGVLCDWAAGYRELCDVPLEEFNNMNREERGAIKEWLFDYELFRNLPPIEEGLKNMKKYIDDPDYVVYVLTATSRFNVENVKRAKREWIDEHIGLENVEDVLFVEKVEHKCKHVADDYEHCILYDDRDKAIDAWIDAGGDGRLVAY